MSREDSESRVRVSHPILPQFFDGSDLLTFAAAVLQPGDVKTAGSSLLVVAGLDLDFARRPFGGVLRLAHAALEQASDARGDALSTADVAIHRLSARCSRGPPGAPCGSQAPFSQRLRAGGVDTVLVGGGEFYQPSCAVHHSCDPVDADAWLAPAHIE